MVIKPNTFPRVVHLVMLLLAVSACRQEDQFEYLRFTDDALISQHALKMSVRHPADFEAIGPVHRSPTFNGKPFKVSLAAFIGDSSFIMVHAETLAEMTGDLDYSDLDSTMLSGFVFTSRSECAELTEEDVRREHDISFLATNGFDPRPGIYIKQYFMTSSDGNAEYVISYGKRINGCDGYAESPEFQQLFEHEIRDLIIVSEIP